MSSVTVCCISCNDLCVFVVQCGSWGEGGLCICLQVCGYTINGRSVSLFFVSFCVCLCVCVKRSFEKRGGTTTTKAI